MVIRVAPLPLAVHAEAAARLITHVATRVSHRVLICLNRRVYVLPLAPSDVHTSEIITCSRYPKGLSDSYDLPRLVLVAVDLIHQSLIYNNTQMTRGFTLECLVLCFIQLPAQGLDLVPHLFVLSLIEVLVPPQHL